MINIEFFHDVICSFCFPMSYRMRKIKEKYNNIEIVHKSFALNWSPEDFVTGFGSRESAKGEILNHWYHANQNDDEHRFNIEGMRNNDVQFPTSKSGLIATKAAGILGGEEKYWDIFDALQENLFVKNNDIEDINLIEEIVKNAGLDLEEWKKLYNDKKTEKKVFEDLELAQNYGINSAPTLIIDGKYLLQGAQPFEVIENALLDISKKEGKPLTKLKKITADDTGICKVEEGKIICE